MRLRSLFGALAAGALLSAAPAPAKELKLSHFMAPNHPMDVHLMRPLAQELAKATNGKLTVKVYPAGELGKGPEQQYKRAVTGVSEMAFGLPQYTPKQFPRLTVLNSPGLFSDPVAATRSLWKSVDLIQPEFSEVKLLGAWFNERTVLITKGKAVRAPADLRGMKIRVPDPVSGRAVTAWGGVPVSLPPPEVYNGLNNGVVDGVWMAASAIENFKLHEIAKHVTLNLPTPLATFYIVMNKDAYAGLGAEERAAIDKIAGLPLSEKAAQVYKREGENALELARKSGIEMIGLADADAAALAKAMQPAIDEQVASMAQGGGFDAKTLIQAVVGSAATN